MKQKFSKYSLFALLFALAFALPSCGGGGDDPEPEPVQQTDRAYLEESALKFLGYIKPSDQSTAIKALHTFVVLLETYTLPPNFHDQVEDVERLKGSAQCLADALEEDDYFALSRATQEFIYSMSRFKGMYQANSSINEWQYIEDRDQVLFRFYTQGKDFNIEVSGSGGEWTATVPGNYADYVFIVPKDLTLKMYTGTTAGDSPMINASVSTEGKDASYFNCTLIGRFANIEVKSNTKCTNTKATEDLTVYYHNPSTYYRYTMIVSTMQVNGNDICSISKWKSLADATDTNKVLESIFKTGSLSADFIDRLTVKCETSDFGGIISEYDVVWTSGDAKILAEASASDLTKTNKVKVYYTAISPSKVAATVSWQAYQCDDTPGANAWGVRPVITFASDNSTYDFDSFFGHGRFMSVERQFNTLVNQYKNYLK